MHTRVIGTVGFVLASLLPHWRARVRTDHPFQPVTPWTWLPWNAVTEAKLRAGRTPVSASAVPLPSHPLPAPR
jgi:hypothetical protein